jgi:hypothetical protein
LQRNEFETLETLFLSKEQTIENIEVKTKEERLRVKMAKKEFMISCVR